MTPDPQAAVELRQVFPGSGTIGVRDLLAGLELAAEVPVGRPYTTANFVSTVDGRATFQGRSGPLSNPADRQMFHGLREHPDAVLVGTGTLRAERYGRLIPDPERRRRRAASGLSPEPLACTVSRSGDIPMDIPLFSEPAAHIVVFTSKRIDTSRIPARVDVVHLDPGEPNLNAMLRRLRSDYDVRTVLCEGGPTLFGALLHENLVDELFLTLAAKLIGGGAGHLITTGPALAELRSVSLMWALEFENALFLRYGLH